MAATGCCMMTTVTGRPFRVTWLLPQVVVWQWQPVTCWCSVVPAPVPVVQTACLHCLSFCCTLWLCDLRSASVWFYFCLYMHFVKMVTIHSLFPVHAHTQTHTHTRMRTYAHTHTHIHAHVCTRTGAHVYTQSLSVCHHTTLALKSVIVIFVCGAFDCFVMYVYIYVEHVIT